MKKEIYQSLVQLEALSKIMKGFMDKGISSAIINLDARYTNICNILEKHLSADEFENIGRPAVGGGSSRDEREGYMRSLYMSLEMTVAFLKSLDMTFEKKEKEFNEAIVELKLKEERLKQSQEMLDTILNPLSINPFIILLNASN